MTRVLIALLSLSAMGYLAYRSMYMRAGPEGGTPQERLENAKKAAQRIEQQQEQHLQEIDEKTTE